MNRSLRQKSVLPDMDNEMSQKTKKELVARLPADFLQASPRAVPVAPAFDVEPFFELHFIRLDYLFPIKLIN